MPVGNPVLDGCNDHDGTIQWMEEAKTTVKKKSFLHETFKLRFCCWQHHHLPPSQRMKTAFLGYFDFPSPSKEQGRGGEGGQNLEEAIISSTYPCIIL